jgi:CBS domain-containing protein
MLTANRPLLELTAEQIMSREILTIPEGMSLQAAARRLASARVTGAPVTDNNGRCIGMLSQTDLLRFLDKACECGHWPASEQECVYADWQVIDELPETSSVRQHMNTHVVTAPPSARITELARLMYERHIHRVVITDPEERVLGLVSTMDILGVIAAEEAFGVQP